MAKFTKHLNGNLLAVVDCETTGLDPENHQIWQISVLPLDSNLDPNPDILPFYMQIRVDDPENIDPGAKLTSGMIAKIQQAPLDQYDSAQHFEDWFEHLNLGPRKRIMVLAQNWAFDRAFIKKWLGNLTFEYIFDPRYRDLMSASLFINDRASFQDGNYTFAAHNLAAIANCLDVPHEFAHDALADCVVTAKCYKKICAYSYETLGGMNKEGYASAFPDIAVELLSPKS